MYTSELLGTLREGKQVSKLTLANSQNASDFDKLRVREIYTSKRLLVRIIHVSQTCSRLLVAVRTTAKETKYLIPFSLKISARQLAVRNINSNLYIRYGQWHFKGREFGCGLTVWLWEKILSAKLCKCTKKLTSSPGKQLPAFSAYSITGTTVG